MHILGESYPREGRFVEHHRCTAICLPGGATDAGSLTLQLHAAPLAQTFLAPIGMSTMLGHIATSLRASAACISAWMSSGESVARFGLEAMLQPTDVVQIDCRAACGMS